MDAVFAALSPRSLARIERAQAETACARSLARALASPPQAAHAPKPGSRAAAPPRRPDRTPPPPSPLPAVPRPPPPPVVAAPAAAPHPVAVHHPVPQPPQDEEEARPPLLPHPVDVPPYLLSDMQRKYGLPGHLPPAPREGSEVKHMEETLEDMDRRKVAQAHAQERLHYLLAPHAPEPGSPASPPDPPSAPASSGSSGSSRVMPRPPPRPEVTGVHEQWAYNSWGRPEIILQFCRHDVNDGSRGILRCISSWHGRLHETSWSNGRYTKTETHITLEFRYKEPTTFKVLKKLKWDTIDKMYMSDLVYMRSMRVSAKFWDWVRRKNFPPCRAPPEWSMVREASLSSDSSVQERDWAFAEEAMMEEMDSVEEEFEDC